MNFNFINQKTNLISILLAFTPLSFIAGNPAININIVLIVIFSLFFDGKKIFNIKLLLIDKLIILFFIFSLITVAVNSLENYHLDKQNIDLTIVYKTIFFLRYLLLYFVLRFYLDNDKLKLNIFLISSSLCVLFVCFDLFYQQLFGQDIFGYKISHVKLSGPFGAELIAGSYIQRFSFFLFFSILFLINFKRNFNKKSIFLLTAIVIVISLLIAGNRMPLLLFLFLFFLFFILNANLQKYFFIALVSLPLIFFLFIKDNEKAFNNFHGAYIQIKNITYNYFYNYEEFVPKKVPEQIYQFRSGLYTWSFNNKILGGGIKSFKFNCWPAHEKLGSKWSCDTHPHNYYIEILSELGLIGLLIILIIFLLLISSFTKNFSFKRKFDYENVAFQIFFLLLLAEFFPIKSSGSFFSTFNAAYIFLLMPIFVGMSKKINNI